MPTIKERTKRINKSKKEVVKNFGNALTPKYAKMNFANEDSFSKFLSKATKHIIHFKDRGQDVLKVYIAETGEILHSDLPKKNLNGLFVKKQTLGINYPILLWDSKQAQMFTRHDLIVEKIVDKI